MLIKEKIKYITKSWGEEVWYVNDEYYCYKELIFNPYSSTSMHLHPKKRETLTCKQGEGVIETTGKEQLLVVGVSPITVEPGTWHRIKSNKGMIIIEVSTTHSDDDVERLKDVQE